MLKLDAAASASARSTLPTRARYFGVTGNDDVVLVFGLRGNVYRSDDAGKTWTKVERRTARDDRRRD